MPTVTPSYLYTFLAMIAVSTLLVLSFTAYVNAMRFSSEAGQLAKLMDRMAAKSTELLTLVSSTNATSEMFLQMPTAIGERQYWLQLRNDSLNAWIEGGFGNQPVQDANLRISLPKEAVFAGHYVGGYGAAHLKCEIVSGLPRMQLTSFGGVD